MVLTVVHSVDTDDVGSQLLELSDITLADNIVGEGVLCVGSSTGLVIDTTDVEALGALEEGVTLDGDGLESGSRPEVVGGNVAGRSKDAGGKGGQRGHGERLHLDDF